MAEKGFWNGSGILAHVGKGWGVIYPILVHLNLKCIRVNDRQGKAFIYLHTLSNLRKIL